MNSLVVSGVDVYAAGYSMDSSGVMVPGGWINGTWIGIASIDVTKDSEIMTLAVVVN